MSPYSTAWVHTFAHRIIFLRNTLQFHKHSSSLKVNAFCLKSLVGKIDFSYLQLCQICFHGQPSKAHQSERRNSFPRFPPFFFPFSSFFFFFFSTQQVFSEYLHVPAIALAVADTVVNITLENINYVIPYLTILL